MQEFFIAGVLFIAIGVFMTLVRAAVEHYRIFQAGIPVNARITGKTVSACWHRHRISTTYTWEYELDGISYTCNSKQCPVTGRDIGDKGTLLVKRQNPSKIYRFMSEHDRHIMKYAGITITGIGILFLILFFYMRTGISLLPQE